MNNQTQNNYNRRELKNFLLSWFPIITIELIIDIIFSSFYANKLSDDIYYCLIGILIVDFIHFALIILSRWDNKILNKIRYYVGLFSINYYCMIMVITFDTVIKNRKYLFSGLYIYFILRISFWLIFVVSLVVILILMILISCFTDRATIIRIITRTNDVVGLNLGMTEEDFNKLNHYKFKNNALVADDENIIKMLDDEHRLCSICMLDYEENSDITLLDCSHSYDKECIKEWLLLRNTCPFCREQVNVSQI